MNRGQLEEVMGFLFKRSPVNFLGVFSFDKIPEPARISGFSPCCYIVNTDTTAGKGKHWVAFFHLSTTSIEFFDSFGRTPASLGFHLPYIQRLVHSSIQVQGDYSRCCGAHCIYYLYHRSLGYTLAAIVIRLKSTTLSQSDIRVAKFLSKVYSMMKVIK